MRLSGCDFDTAKARVLGESGCNEPPTLKATPQTGQAATRATVEALAQAKKLPLDFLRGFGLENQSQGVFIPYRLADNSPARRNRIRAFMEHVKSPPWCYWTPGPGESEPYGLWRLAEARKAGYLILEEGESDWWTLWFHWFPALGIPGAEMVKVLKGEHLAGIPKVFIIQEADPSGVTFVQNTLARLKEFGWTGETRIISLAPIKDASELHRADPEKFKATFQAALNAAQDVAKWKAEAATIGPWAGIESMETFLSGDDDDAEFLDDGNRFLARQCITEVFSPRGLGKTLFALWLAVLLAMRGSRVLYIDRDNPRRVMRNRLRSFGATFETANLRVITREKCPPLTNVTAWASFPYAEYDMVIVDSLDSASEGTGEQDSAKPSKALAPLLDIARREKGPAVLILGNTIKSAAHSRGSGVIEDRSDIVYEVRDASGLKPSGSKPWWEELPPSDAASWAARASRRKQQEKYRLAFIASKFRIGPEPEPFIFEIDTTTDPWTVKDVTDQVDAEGAAAREQRAQARAETIEKAVAALVTEISRRNAAKEPALLKKQAEEYLTHLVRLRITQREAREITNSKTFELVPVEGKKGRPKAVQLAGKKEESNRNSGVVEGSKTLGENGADFGCPQSMHPTEIDPIQTRETCGSEKPPISVDDSLSTPPSGLKGDADEEVI
jgi:hypothetical protein